MKQDWQSGYEDCPGNCGVRCLYVCNMCNAGPGRIGIGCLNCECCYGNPDEVI